MSGFITLERGIFDNFLYFSEPFTRSSAWIDLLLLANHKESTFYKRGIQIKVGRGCLARSMKELADRWDWSIGKVKRFLELLENENQIKTNVTNTTTKICIVNYSKYQEKRKPNGNQTETYNNENNDKQNKVLSFDLFWNMYPSKTAKKKCQDKWDRMTEEEIKKSLDSVPKYLNTKNVKEGFIKNPLTWLNGGCWDDEYEEAKPISQASPDYDSYKGVPIPEEVAINEAKRIKQPKPY